MADLPPPTVDPERVRQTVEEVLSRPEYAPLEPSLLERLQQWLVEQLGRVIDAVGGSAGGVIAWVVVLLGLAIVAAVAARVVRGLRPDRDVGDEAMGMTGRRAADWAADAAGHEEAGRWRDALRCRYRQLVAELAAAGLVEEAPGRTTGEYLAQIRDRLPEANANATAVTRAFEATWYGNAPVTEAEVAAFRQATDEVRRLATSRGAAVGVAT